MTPANLSSSWAYRRELAANLRRFTALAVVSFIGGLLGAYVLTLTGNAAFRRLVPWLLLFATVLFWASPWIVQAARTLARHEADHPHAGMVAAGLGIQFVTSAYGGFFGAGMGIIMLAALAITEGGDDYHVINAAKHLCGTLIQISAVVLFVVAGLVSWPETVVVGAASVLGGYAGVVFGRRIPPRLMRWLVIGVGAALTVYFFVRG